MTDEKLKALLNQIGIKNYFNAVKKLQEEYCLDDREIEQLVSHDYSFVAAKFAYFKKSWINAYNQTKNRTSNQLENKLSIDEISSCGELEKKLCDYLCANDILSLFEAKSMQSILGQKIKEYSFDLFIVAFDYSVTKVLRIISSLQKPTAYFITALDSNLKKVASMFITDDDVLALKTKYGLK